MPHTTMTPDPQTTLLVTLLLIVRDVAASQHFYVDVLGAKLLQSGPPAFLKLGNAFLTLNTGGGPTEDKPNVQAAPPDNPNRLSIALNLRVTDIHATYRTWKERGANFLTEPMDRGEEIRCYMSDPDGYLIEVGQSLRSDDRMEEAQ